MGMFISFLGLLVGFFGFSLVIAAFIVFIVRRAFESTLKSLFEANVHGRFEHCKRALDLKTIEDELRKLLLWLEDKELNHGHTTIFFKGKRTSIGTWYKWIHSVYRACHEPNANMYEIKRILNQDYYEPQNISLHPYHFFTRIVSRIEKLVITVGLICAFFGTLMAAVPSISALIMSLY